MLLPINPINETQSFFLARAEAGAIAAVEQLWQENHFPMQKWSKILFSISSVITSPVISSRLKRADLRSI